MPSNLKNLSYESNEPSFLRKLRAENAGGISDRQERPIARPKRSKDTDDDDGPTYVLEENNDTLSKEEYEALINGGAGANKDKTTEDAEVGSGEQSQAGERGEQFSKQQATGIGTTQKKRKLGKVVGTEEAKEATAEKKSKKKAKAVKLSFGDDEAG